MMGIKVTGIPTRPDKVKSPVLSRYRAQLTSAGLQVNGPIMAQPQGSGPRPIWSPPVAEPPELSRLKCAGHHHKGNTDSNALQTEQSLVCRVTSRYNHRFSDRTSIPRTKASPEILQPPFYNTGKVMITNQFKLLLQNQLK